MKLREEKLKNDIDVLAFKKASASTKDKLKATAIRALTQKLQM